MTLSKRRVSRGETVEERREFFYWQSNIQPFASLAAYRYHLKVVSEAVSSAERAASPAPVAPCIPPVNPLMMLGANDRLTPPLTHLAASSGSVGDRNALSN